MAVSLPLELPLLHRAEVQCGPPASSRSHLETPAPVPAARPPAPAARVVVSAEEVSIRDVNRRARTPRMCHSLPPPAAASASSAHGSLTDQPSRDAAYGRARVVQAPSPPELHLARARLPRPSPRHSSRARWS